MDKVIEKIKAFFHNTWVKVVSWLVLAASIVALIIGGTTKDEVSSYVVLAFSVIAGVSALIAFITNCVKSDK